MSKSGRRTSKEVTSLQRRLLARRRREEKRLMAKYLEPHDDLYNGLQRLSMEAWDDSAKREGIGD